MIKAFVGIKVAASDVYEDWTKLTNTGDKVAQIDGVSKVHGLFGRYDLMAIIDVETLEEINQIVSEKIRAIKGVQSTETFIVSF
jgi:DNA-binding Lrp family transcriptional regulator